MYHITVIYPLNVFVAKQQKEQILCTTETFFLFAVERYVSVTYLNNKIYN